MYLSERNHAAALDAADLDDVPLPEGERRSIARAPIGLGLAKVAVAPHLYLQIRKEDKG